METWYLIMHEDRVLMGTTDAFTAYESMFLNYHVDTDFETFMRILEEKDHFSVESKGFIYDVFVQHRLPEPPPSPLPFDEQVAVSEQEFAARKEKWKRLYGKHYWEK